jgi:hypothetical protein
MNTSAAFLTIAEAPDGLDPHPVFHRSIEAALHYAHHAHGLHGRYTPKAGNTAIQLYGFAEGGYRLRHSFASQSEVEFVMNSHGIAPTALDAAA